MYGAVKVRQNGGAVDDGQKTWSIVVGFGYEKGGSRSVFFEVSGVALNLTFILNGVSFQAHLIDAHTGRRLTLSSGCGVAPGLMDLHQNHHEASTMRF